MGHKTNPCPICGHPVTTYVPDEFPKDIQLEGEQHVVVRNQEEEAKLRAPASPQASASPRDPAALKAEILADELALKAAQ